MMRIILILMMLLSAGAAAVSLLTLPDSTAASTTAPSATSPSTSATDLTASCNQLVDEWKTRLAAEHFSMLVAPPFVIAGDGGRGRLERYRDGTILAAASALHATYFEKSPTRPILIVLFESEEPYRRLAKKWFNDQDVSHFGYYRTADNIMVMNVSTGTGTLVHELVHALMKPDFPDVPAWFNEGLASLYEQSSINGDSIDGLVNWRLPALQDAIRQGKLRPLRAMISDSNFYSADLAGLNYAQSRYLMMYLQERNELKGFYRSFRDHHADDPTGIQSLEKIIEPQTLENLDDSWRRWVVNLSN